MNNINMNDNVFKSFEIEHWKPIKGFSGYQVSDHGRIKSLKFGKERILKPWVVGAGYLQVSLWNEGTEQKKLVHRLVLEAFMGNPEEKQECNHKNGNKTDNYLGNLEWKSHSENMRHADETGLWNIKGEKNSQAKLTENEVLEILNDSVAGVPQQEIAVKYNVDRSTISLIKTGRTWSHVTGIAYKKPYSKKPAVFSPISGKAGQPMSLEVF